MSARPLRPPHVIATTAKKQPPKGRALAYKSMIRLNVLLKQNRHEECVDILLGRTDHRVFSQTPGRRHVYQRQYGLVMRAGEGEGDMKLRPLSVLAVRRAEPWNRVLTALGERGLWLEAFRLYRWMVRKHVQPTEETLTSLLEACTARMQQHARELRKRHPDGRDTPASSGHRPQRLPPAQNTIYMRAVKAFKSIAEQPGFELNIIHVNSMIKCASWAGDWEMAFRLYQRLRPASDAAASERKPRNNTKVLHANTNWIDEEEAEEVKRQLNEASRKTLQQQLSELSPDKVTYATLLSACASRGGDAAFDDAMTLWRDIKQKSLQQSSNESSVTVDTEMINALLMACKGADAREKVERVFPLVAGEFGNYFEWPLFEKYYAECVDSNDTTPIRTRLNAETAAELAPSTDGADLIYPTPLTPNAKTLSILMTLMVKRLEFPVPVVRSLYQFMTEPTENYRFYRAIVPDTALETSCLQLLIDSHAHEHAFRLFDRLSRRTAKQRVRAVMPPHTYQVIMKACVQSGDVDRARKYWSAVEDFSDRQLAVAQTSAAGRRPQTFQPTGMTAVYLLQTLMKQNQQQQVVDRLKRLAGDVAHAGGWRQRMVTELDTIGAAWHMGWQACAQLLKREDLELSNGERHELKSLRKAWMEKAKKIDAGESVIAETGDEDDDEDLSDDGKFDLLKDKTPRWLKKKLQSMSVS